MLHLTIFATLALSQLWYPDLVCDSEGSRARAALGYLTDDENRERVKLTMHTSLLLPSDCADEDFSVDVRITRDEACEDVIQECGFGHGNATRCLDKPRPFAQLIHDGSTQDGNKWHTYYVCERHATAEGTEVLPYEAFREVKAFWDVDGAILTSEKTCTEALKAQNSVFLLEWREVYTTGVLCTGFRNVPVLDISPLAHWESDTGDDVPINVMSRNVLLRLRGPNTGTTASINVFVQLVLVLLLF